VLEITAKRLDSDEIVETVSPIDAAFSEMEIRERLSRAVRTVYPEAEFRSYAEGAATFLAPKLLVVAVYRPAEGRDEKRGSEDAAPQQQLFAA
jgi:hypothetical protein